MTKIPNPSLFHPSPQWGEGEGEGQFWSLKNWDFGFVSKLEIRN